MLYSSRKNSWFVRKSWFVLLAGFLTACGDGSDEKLADISAINIESFPTTVQPLVTDTYDRLLASPSDPSIHGQLAMIAHAHGKLDVAGAYYDRAEALSPQTFAWTYLRGVVFMEQGLHEEAIASFRRALSIKADYAAAKLHLAESLQKTGDLSGGREAFESLITARPDHARAFFGLGQVYLEQGDSEKAVEMFERAVVLVPYYGAAYYALAQIYQQQGDTERADLYRKQFEKFRNATPPALDPVLARVHVIRDSVSQKIIRAGRLSAAGRFQEAADVFVGILQSDPKNIVAHVNLVGLLGSLGQVERATAYYDAGRALAPNEPKLHNNFGILMLKQKRYVEAEAAFRAAIATDPDYAAAHRYLGMTLQNLRRPDDALDSYRAAWAADPLDHQSGYLVANSLLNNGDTAQAIASFERILEPVNNKTPSYMRALARALYIDGDSDRSREMLRRARTSAQRLGQTALVVSIDEDLKGIDERQAESDDP